MRGGSCSYVSLREVLTLKVELREPLKLYIPRQLHCVAALLGKVGGCDLYPALA